MTDQPTTACLLTAPARGGIAVISLAGPGAEDILARVFRPRGHAARGEALSLGRIVRGGETIDEAIVAFDPRAARAEINVHGGPQVGRAVLALLAECGAEIIPGAPADASLLAVATCMGNPAVASEMLAALRGATTPLVASAVTCQWSGGLSKLADDVLAGKADRACADDLQAAAEGLTIMRRLLEPAEVVIAGPPNVGKSALANALVGRNVSIVSETPGTTRDWVRTLIDADGVPVWLTDTAGLWEAECGVDAEAVRRAWERIATADLLLCVTAGAPGPWADLVARVRALPHVLHVSGKCDLTPPIAPCGSDDLTQTAPRGSGGSVSIPVSGKTLAGIDTLRRAIRDRLGFADFDPRRPMAFTERQAVALGAAAHAARAGSPDDAKKTLRELLRG